MNEFLEHSLLVKKSKGVADPDELELILNMDALRVAGKIDEQKMMALIQEFLGFTQEHNYELWAWDNPPIIEIDGKQVDNLLRWYFKLTFRKRK